LRTKLDAAQVRSLLGGFSLDSLHRVTEALSELSPGRMLADRGGSGAQRQQPAALQPRGGALLSQPAGGQGGDVKLIPASAQERERLTQIAGPFSEEDLTRYLQLSLDLFTDLQASLQPRFIWSWG